MAAALVDQTIKEHKVTIFSKSYCPYCKMAKKVFDSLHQAYFALELDERDDGKEIQQALSVKTGVKTVPQVFVNSKFLGGGTDVKKLHKSGELSTMLGK